jgi:hypothetical protein
MLFMALGIKPAALAEVFGVLVGYAGPVEHYDQLGGLPFTIDGRENREGFDALGALMGKIIHVYYEPAPLDCRVLDAHYAFTARPLALAH